MRGTPYSDKEPQISYRRLESSDIPQLVDYLNFLSVETRSRFGPHGYDHTSIRSIYQDADAYRGYIAIDPGSADIIAYAIVKIGWLAHELPRLASYGLQPAEGIDATFAPSVGDQWQGLGIGKDLFQFIRLDLDTIHIRRIILWGGVQASNERALRYYHNLGFRTLGEFEYHGRNFDMMYDSGQ